MTGIIIFSALLSTTGLYTLLTRPYTGPKHRKGQ